MSLYKSVVNYGRCILRLLTISTVFAASTSSATTVEFYAQYIGSPYTQSLYWEPQDGFSLGALWDNNGGRDSRNAPYIPGSMAWISSTFGPFTFNAIRLGGWPWEDFSFPWDKNVPLYFYKSDGSIVEREIFIPANNSFITFAEDIPLVSGIRIGSGSYSVLGIRLDSITFNESPSSSVPEPPTWSMMFAGFVVFGLLARRKSPM